MNLQIAEPLNEEKDRGMKIIVMDQEELTLKILGDFLADLGHEVVRLKSVFGQFRAEAKNGGEADLIIVDPGRLDEDGLALIEEIHRYQANADIVIMSYINCVIPCQHAIAQGIYSYLPKPVRLTELELLLARVKERREAQIQARRPKSEFNRNRPNRPEETTGQS